MARFDATRQRDDAFRLFELSADVMGVAGFDGYLRAANPAYERILGWSPEELHSRPFMEFVHPEDRQHASEVLATLAEGGELSDVEARLLCHDGSHRLFLISLRGEPDESLVYFVGVDVTRYRAAEELVELAAGVLGRVTRHEPLAEILDALTLGIETLADGMLASVLVADADGAHLRHGSAPSLPPAYNASIDGIAIGPTTGSCGTAAHRGEPVIVADVATDPLWLDFRALAAEHGLRACWSTPIPASDGAVLGTFALYYREPRSPDPFHRDLIGTATHLARTAIEHDRAERQLRDSEARFRTVATEVPVGIFEADAEGGVVFANDRLCEIVGSTGPEIHGDGWAVHVHVDDRQRIVGEWARAVTTSSPWSSEFRVLRPDGGERIVAATATPVRSDGGGFLGSCTDLTDSRRAEREHEIAQTLQRSLLPDRLPSVPGMETAVRYQAGAAGVDVGGDWYDVFVLPGGRVGVVVGDVVGRGVRAAAAMGQLRTALHTIARIAPEPADVIRRLGEQVDGDASSATVVYGIVDPGARTFEFACAGHPPPLLSGVGYVEGGRNPPLGIVAGGPHDAVVELAPGATLLLYTDGLVERRQGGMDPGMATLARTLEQHRGDLEQLCDTVLAALDVEAAGDDVALLALRLPA